MTDKQAGNVNEKFGRRAKTYVLLGVLALDLLFLLIPGWVGLVFFLAACWMAGPVSIAWDLPRSAQDRRYSRKIVGSFLLVQLCVFIIRKAIVLIFLV